MAHSWSHDNLWKLYNVAHWTHYTYTIHFHDLIGNTDLSVLCRISWKKNILWSVIQISFSTWSMNSILWAFLLFLGKCYWEFYVIVPYNHSCRIKSINNAMAYMLLPVVANKKLFMRAQTVVHIACSCVLHVCMWLP